MKRLIECVPNFSEGRDMGIIKQITDQIETVQGVKLLDVDPGAATNRTVVTFVGTPDEVCEAAFRAVRKASELIDMRKHKGEHPRFGATDVLPLVPISGITMEETAEYARRLAKRVGEELGISIYCYENAAFEEKRRNLANCRAGEYEGLAKKLTDPAWKPDFGPTTLNERSGATAVGARNFLVAYNVNLNTTSVRRANAIAFDVREAGRTLRDGDPVTGKIRTDEKGEPIRIPGTLQKVKAIGWYIQEYGIAQISMNLTDITVTSVHKAFDEVERSARERGIRVTGSELVGLVPLNALLDAGKHYLEKQQRSVGLPDEELIKIAVKSLGLDELKPFNPKEKVIEYLLGDDMPRPLINMTLQKFADETSSESPAPGGGSISAYMGAMGAALAAMVANLSSHKRGWDERWKEFSDWAVKARGYQQQLMALVDEDTAAFNRIMAAFELPKNTPDEKTARQKAIQDATRYATEVPFRTMNVAYEALHTVLAMAETGNPNSVTDAGVGALACRSAVIGAYLNVKINAAGLDDKAFAADILAKGAHIETKAKELEQQILTLVNSKITG